MKQTGFGITMLLCAAMSLSACGNSATENNDTDGPHIVTTIFPEYDWTRKIIGDTEAELTLLLDGTVDLHSYQPTAADIVRISSCDLLIYVGGESDEWVEEILRDNPEIRSLNLMDTLGTAVKEEEYREGMEPVEKTGEENLEYDEHVWLSLKNAVFLCSEITDALCAVCPANAETYRTNAAAYQADLLALDERYQSAVAAAGTKTLLFGDRFPFRYLTDDYDLDYYAAFAGCSAETEASFETIIFLARKVDELNLPAVCQIEGSNGRIARTIIENTTAKDAQILTFHSLQSVGGQSAESISYLSAMEQNLSVLEDALQ